MDLENSPGERASGLGRAIGETWKDRTARHVLILCTIIAFIDGVDTQLMVAFAPIMAKSLAINVSQFGIVFSISLLGTIIGSVAFGALADRFGRKLMIIAALVLVSLGTIAIGVAGKTLTLILLFRFVAGIGIGGVIPNLVALTSEYAPPQSRVFMTNAMFCGYPLGSVAVGFLGSLVVNIFEWPLIFLTMGLVSLIFVIVAWLFLPETRELQPLQTKVAERISVRQLFSAEVRFLTGLIWIATFLAWLTVIMISIWINPLLVREGMSISSAIRYPAYFSIGGIVGSVLIGWLLDRSTAKLVLSAAMAVGALALLSVPWMIANHVLLVLSVLVAGFTIIGAQIGLQSYAATIYRPNIRATGVGWVLAVGRAGSLIGPIIGSMLIEAHWPSSTILAVMGIPTAFAAAVLVLIRPSEREMGDKRGCQLS